MSDERLEELLAGAILGWKVGPNRFMKSGRSWIPRWRFNPLGSLEDAFLLLHEADAAYKLTVDTAGAFNAEVRIGDRLGIATGNPKPRTITIAIARALGLEVA